MYLTIEREINGAFIPCMILLMVKVIQWRASHILFVPWSLMFIGLSTIGLSINWKCSPHINMNLLDNCPNGGQLQAALDPTKIDYYKILKTLKIKYLINKNIINFSTLSN